MLKILKKPDQHGRIVVVDRVRKFAFSLFWLWSCFLIKYFKGFWDISLFDGDDGIRAWVLTADEILRSCEAACDKGVVAILDFGEYTYAQARVLTPSVAIKGIHMLVVGS